MRLIINGEEQEYQGAPTLDALLKELETHGERVATMVNDTMVARGERAEIALCDGDRVEILMFAGGG